MSFHVSIFNAWRAARSCSGITEHFFETPLRGSKEGFSFGILGGVPTQLIMWTIRMADFREIFSPKNASIA